MPNSERFPRTIFVADDNPADQEIVRLAFKGTGFSPRFETAEDGEEAMFKLGLGPVPTAGAEHSAVLPRLPDIVLLDLNLPRLSGREVLKAIRTSEPHCHLPVAILSGSARHEDVLWCYRNGCNCYVQKSEFRLFQEDIRRFAEFWMNTALLPG